jgi:hypothetical protein
MSMTKRKQKSARRARLVPRILGRVFAVLAALYAALFAVFYFDLDGKLIYYVVEPLLVRHYDRMERRNPLDVPYEMRKSE